MGAKSAVKMQKWGQKAPSKQQSDGKKRHYISNCGSTLTTTYHIQGAGAPAKTKNYVNADAFIFFREKVRPFPHLAKPVNTILRKDEKAMVQIKRDWFDTAFGKLRKEKNVWQMEREDTSLTGKIIRYR